MALPPPFRNRPDLHLAFLTQLTGSPPAPGQATPTSSPFHTPQPTPGDTPFAKTAYSPFRSASLKPPNEYREPVSSRPSNIWKSCFGSYRWYRFKRILSTKTICLLLMVLALTRWWFNGGRKELDIVRLGASGFGKDFLQERRMQNYQFYPATNPKIHYIGRWTSTPNRLRKDGTFPGVYFDITIVNTSSLFLALHNAPEQVLSTSTSVSTGIPTSISLPGPGHVSFRPVSTNEPSPPVSLLARVDDQEYILLPNSSALVSIRLNDLNKASEHSVRIVAPMTDDHGRGVVELEGLWLSKGGKLVKVAGSLLSEDFVDEDLLEAENDQIGEKHRAGLTNIEKDGSSKNDRQKAGDDDEGLLLIDQDQKKILEIITDSPGSFTGKQKGRRTGGADGLLAGVMGWEYLLGEMFGAEHVGIGVDGMCLMQDCIGGTGQPAGIGDVFFRSGPSGSVYFEHAWMFSAYIPDILVINVGGADETSFNRYASDYNKTFWELSEQFETTYVSLIKAIRRLAYPKHPTIVQSERSGTPGIVPSTAPASIPIFVMKPFLGQLEQATQNVVEKLRADGDKSVFWLDTSGWLDPDTDTKDIPDFFLDETVTPSKFRLTEQGNQRVAIFLHDHVCKYLAAAGEKCAFLPHELYQGKVYDPEEANFDRYVENEKERKLKKLFWEDDEELEEEVPAV